MNFLWLMTLTLSVLVWTPLGLSQSSSEFKAEQEIVRVQMVQLSRELGVTCTECHSQKNWKDSSKANFKTALKHLKTVEVLKRNGMDGKSGPEASCFMCHQGRLKFAHKMIHPENGLKTKDAKSKNSSENEL